MPWQPFQTVWLPGWLADPLRRCAHAHQRGIYGDEIIAAGYKRARCLDCGRLLPSLPDAKHHLKSPDSHTEERP